MHHELHEIVVAVGLRGDDGAHLVGRQPVADAVDLAHLRDRVVQQRQQHVDAVEHDPARAELVLLRLEHGEHAGEIELARMHYLGGEARVDEAELLLHQRGQVPVEAGGIGDDLPGAFLERDEQASLAPLAGGIHQALQREHGLARAGSALQKSGLVPRQAAAAQLVEATDAGGNLR